MKINEMLANRAELHEKASALVMGAESEDRDLTAEEVEKFDAFTAQIETMDARISRAKQIEARSIELDKIASRQADPQEVTAADIGAVHERVLDDPARGFSNLGDFASSVFDACRPGAMGVDKRLNFTAAASGMNQGTGSDGGFLVPPEFSTAIWDGLNDPAESLLAATDNYTVTGESLTFNANAETSRATGSRYGGVQGYWISEADQITSSKPKMRQVKIEPQQLAVLVYATDKLLRNTTAAGQYLTRAARDEINFLTGDSIINGDGVGKPLGVLNAGGVVSVAKESGQSATTVVTENILKMWSRMSARSRSNAAWYINQDVEPQLNALNLAVGTAGGQLVFMPAGGVSGAPFATILGRPIIPLEYCATLGTVGDIILGDMSSYVTGTRGSVDEAMSMHLRFDYAETAFRFIFEADGQPWLNSAITPFKGTNTQSTFITLATRA